MYISSYSIHTEKTKLMYPEDPHKYPFSAAIFWIIVVWAIVAWWLLY